MLLQIECSNRASRSIVSTGQIMEAYLDLQLTSDESDKQPLPIHHFVYIFAVSPKLCLPKSGWKWERGRDGRGNFDLKGRWWKKE